MVFVVFEKRKLNAWQRSRFPNPDSIPCVNIPCETIFTDSLEVAKEKIAEKLEEGRWSKGFPVHEGNYVVMRLDGGQPLDSSTSEKVYEFEV